jgi:hypothetical protein
MSGQPLWNPVTELDQSERIDMSGLRDKHV